MRVGRSHKSQFSRPRHLFGPFGRHEDDWEQQPGWVEEGWFGRGPDRSDGPQWEGVPEGMMNLLPRAGDFVVMSECLAHAVLPWRPTDRPRITLQLRYKCGSVHAAHARNNPGPWPAAVLAQVSPATRAIVAGDAAALRMLPHVGVTEPRQQSCTHPPAAGCVLMPPDPAALIVSVQDEARMISNDATFGGRVRDVLPDNFATLAVEKERGFMVAMNQHHLLTGAAADGQATCSAEHSDTPAFDGLTHTERYLLDAHGILILRGAMSVAEIQAARAAVERTLLSSMQQPYGGILGEPALEALITHPRLLPVLLELMDGQPHLVSIAALHKPAAEAREKPSGAAQLHCQREYGRNNAHFAVRKPGRVYAGVVAFYATIELSGSLGGLHTVV
eukprot:SAG31_NODE_9482_length_1270_cov_1.146883_1_plen_390_part_00